jgi:hypothetical protein
MLSLMKTLEQIRPQTVRAPPWQYGRRAFQIFWQTHVEDNHCRWTPWLMASSWRQKKIALVNCSGVDKILFSQTNFYPKPSMNRIDALKVLELDWKSKFSSAGLAPCDHDILYASTFANDPQGIVEMAHTINNQTLPSIIQQWIHGKANTSGLQTQANVVHRARQLERTTGAVVYQ